MSHKQIYIAFYSFESSLGLDPNDSIIPFVVFVSSSATLWICEKKMVFLIFDGLLGFAIWIKKSCNYQVRQGCWSACFIKCLMKLKKVETQIQVTLLPCYSKVDTRRSNINKMMKFLLLKVVEDDVHSKPTNMLPASWSMEDSLGL
ncbi:hypothetical protein P8452_58920 [Trifolium repens]|nr:hypothetical protein P8452_58920 [Trifolium repens]